jgi:hypothetical protein
MFNYVLMKYIFIHMQAYKFRRERASLNSNQDYETSVINICVHLEDCDFWLYKYRKVHTANLLFNYLGTLRLTEEMHWT